MNHRRPKISVVINNYNYEGYLAEAIESALAQTYTDCEVIVVDDGSTDGSRQLIEEYGDRVEVIFKENGGQASAFNVGIEAAKGEYILLLDADDLLLPNAVEVALQEIGSDVVRLCFGLDRVDAEGQSLGAYPMSPRSVGFKGTLRDALVENSFFPGTPTSGNLFRAKELKLCLPVPEEAFRICADLYLFCKNAEFGLIQILPDSLACYRVHGQNNYFRGNGRFGVSRKQLDVQLRNVLNTWKLFSEYGEEFSPSDQRIIRNFVMTINSLEIISDAKLQGLTVVGLDQWSSSRIMLASVPGVFRARGLRSLLRGLFGVVTIITNEVLPCKLGQCLHRPYAWLLRAEK